MTEVAPTAADVQAALVAVAVPADASHLQRFFKTGPGSTARATSSSVCAYR